MRKLVTVTMFLVAMASATFATTKTSIKVTELSKAIVEDISKSYSGYTIKEAFKVETANVITFEVLVVKASDKLILTYDKDGKFLKKLSLPAPVAKAQNPVNNNPAVKK